MKEARARFGEPRRENRHQFLQRVRDAHQRNDFSEPRDSSGILSYTGFAAQMAKNSPGIRRPRLDLGSEKTLAMAIHSSIRRRISWTEELGSGYTVYGLQNTGHDRAYQQFSLFKHTKKVQNFNQILWLLISSKIHCLWLQNPHIIPALSLALRAAL